jgi:undecaprenyl-diphosphatase
MDTMITQWINAFAGENTALDVAMIATTTFGVPLMILAVVSLWWLGRPRDQLRHAAIASGLTFLLGLGFAQVVLLFVHRMRPYDAGVSHLIIAPTADWSFPSDHATASLAIVFAFALQGLRRWTLVFLIMAALVCFSRVFVGMHYATDILGGAAVAIIAALIVKAVYRRGSKLDNWLVKIL